MRSRLRLAAHLLGDGGSLGDTCRNSLGYPLGGPIICASQKLGRTPPNTAVFVELYGSWARTLPQVRALLRCPQIRLPNPGQLYSVSTGPLINSTQRSVAPQCFSPAVTTLIRKATRTQMSSNSMLSSTSVVLSSRLFITRSVSEPNGCFCFRLID